MKITFLNIEGEVTGSKYLIEDVGQANSKILVDCGLFQGKDNIKYNRDSFPVDPKTIDAIVLTHAHLDHTGYIPYLVKNGFEGKIYSSKATYALCEIILIDSGSLQEGYANLVNRREDSEKISPLYTVKDAQRSLSFFHPVDYDKPFNIGNLTVTLIFSAHILGSSFVVISDGKNKLTFSGDLGRPNQLIMKDPPKIKDTDYLVLESTYGDRIHEESDAFQVLEQVINQTIKKSGILIIPAFAVERTQLLLYCLNQLKNKKLIPDIPVYLDSPMAIAVTELFCQFKEEHTLEESLCKDITRVAKYTRTARESKELDSSNMNGPAIIIAGSGMADGGRVLYHFQKYISDKKNTILFTGYQSTGTLGQQLIKGENKIKIYGNKYIVRAEIKKLDMLSAHADYNEILEWLSGFEKAPKKVFLTHGEKAAGRNLKELIEKKFGWSVVIPKHAESFDLE